MPFLMILLYAFAKFIAEHNKGERFPIQSYPPKISWVIRFTAKDVAKMFFGSIAVEVGVIRSD